MSSVYAYRLIGTFARDVTESDRLIAVGIAWCFYSIFFLIALRKFTMRNTPFILGLGGMTYPLYLLHNRAGKEIYDSLSGTCSPLALVVSIAIFMLLVSWFVHMYLERGIADRLKFNLIAVAQRVADFRGHLSK